MSPRSPDDGHPSPTSQEQHYTESILSSFLRPPDAVPTLNRNAHLNFLARALFQGFPRQYTSQDASQPWFMFWLLQSFSVLGAGIDPDNRRRAVDTILAAQHPDGGFGGGPHQAPHLLPTYASVCALAIVGQSGPEGGWNQINRKGLYNFFLSLKQPDGSFRVAKHAEVDIRGTYCLLATATLLNLLTPTLARGIPGFVSSCQTYEGGFASASQPYYATHSIAPDTLDPNQPSYTTTALLSTPRPPLGEAHGGYTSCALTSWVLLQPFVTEEHLEASRRGVDMRTLVRWLAKMQGGPSDLGGFRGRTNKLVDGCYAWWVGGCFALLESLGVGGGSGVGVDDADSPDAESEDVEWADVEDDLFNKKALQEYILGAAQVPAGGLRDKPPKNPDAYHTLYNLAGLSAAQHCVSPSAIQKAKLEREWVTQIDDPLSLDASETPLQRDARQRRVYVAAQSWVEVEAASRVLGGARNRVNATHPLFNLTVTHARGMMDYFYGQGQGEAL